MSPKSQKKLSAVKQKTPRSSDSKQPRRRLTAADRRKQLIEAAQRVFVRRGFHGTRTRDLAEEAGVNEATFFMHFSTKQEIFDAAITEPLRDLVKRLLEEGRAFASAGAPKAKEQIGFRAIREIYEAVAEMSPLMVAALFHDRDQGMKTYRNDVYPMIRKLRTGSMVSFNITDDGAAEFVALAAMSLCFSLHIHHQMLGEKENIDSNAKQIAGLLLYGALMFGTQKDS